MITHLFIMYIVHPCSAFAAMHDSVSIAYTVFSCFTLQPLLSIVCRFCRRHVLHVWTVLGCLLVAPRHFSLHRMSRTSERCLGIARNRCRNIESTSGSISSGSKRVATTTERARCVIGGGVKARGKDNKGGAMSSR